MRTFIITIYIIIFICLLHINAISQTITAGARLNALANAGSVINDAWNVSGNPAALRIEHPVIGAGYENRFLTNELSLKSAIFAYPLTSNTFGLSFNSFGEDPYHETTASLAYAKMLGPNFSTGLKFNYHSIAIDSYGSDQAYSVELGLVAKILQDLSLATHIINPTQAKISDKIQSPLYTTFKIGSQYNLTQDNFIVSEFEKSLNQSMIVRFASEFSIHKYVTLRSGVSTTPFRFYFGTGVEIQNFDVDISASTLPNLGISPQMCLSYAFR